MTNQQSTHCTHCRPDQPPQPAQPSTLAELADYAPQGIVSRTLIDKPAGTVTLFAFDAGQALSEHQAPFDALVQILDGAAQVTIAGRDINVSAGQIITMPANVPHALRAQQRFKMLLTMIKQT